MLMLEFYNFYKCYNFRVSVIGCSEQNIISITYYNVIMLILLKKNFHNRGTFLGTFKLTDRK